MSSSSQSLAQHQQQQLRLSPQQVRFGRLLEMSAPEFEDEVIRMLDENPALEKSESDTAPVPQADDEGREFTESADELQRADYGSDEEVPYYRTQISNRSADDDYYEPVAVDNGPDGYAALEAQLAELDIAPEEREIARYVIGNLDSNGYLSRSPESIADDLAMGVGITVSPAFVRRTIDIVRSLDPAGIAAYDLRDCLLLQLRRMPDESAVRNALKVLSEYFDLFSKKHFDRIRSALKLSGRDFEEVMKLIRSLNPKPGALLEMAGADDRMSHISPDFEVMIDPDGTISATLLSHAPDLSISPDFSISRIDSIEKHNGGDKRMAEAAAFLRERYDAASEFIDMAARRNETLRKVMQAVIKLQYDFFLTNDRSKLRPMVLRDIRDLTGLDLSVISRATSGKYAMTPGGMVSLKSLFSESVNEEGNLSAHFIEASIRKLIEAEDKTKPLSDEAICAMLKDKGLDVARRTVAKYRERMGIPVARLRRN